MRGRGHKRLRRGNHERNNDVGKLGHGCKYLFCGSQEKQRVRDCSLNRVPVKIREDLGSQRRSSSIVDCQVSLLSLLNWLSFVLAIAFYVTPVTDLLAHDPRIQHWTTIVVPTLLNENTRTHGLVSAEKVEPEDRDDDLYGTVVSHNVWGRDCGKPSIHDRVTGEEDAGNLRDSLCASLRRPSQLTMAPKPAVDVVPIFNQEVFSSDHVEIPDDRGILIRLDSSSGAVKVETVLDQHYPQIHPNAYAPARLSNVYLLHGGGSGTAVFHGYDRENLQSVVMKHAGKKDTVEVFSLVKIAQELLWRGSQAKEAAQAMRRRIPEFCFVYISPHHLRDRNKELWASRRTRHLDVPTDEEDAMHASTQHFRHQSAMSADRRSVMLTPESRRRSLMHLTDQKCKRRLSIHLSGDEAFIDVNFQRVDLHIPSLQKDGTVQGGVDFLNHLGDELADQEETNHWKVTLAQKAIGGENSENGAVVMTSGKLKGSLLNKLIDDFIAIMRDLQALTLPHEKEGLTEVKKAVARIRKNKDVKTVPKCVDSFVGSAVLKNYHPETGRFTQLREFARQIRAQELCLHQEEAFPAKLLGVVLDNGRTLENAFIEPPASRSAIDRLANDWFGFVEHAASMKNASATDLIWTCGLTDAGLHNTFLSPTRGLELFDLGLPKLMPLPAFLTKFLMSFFHTFGMEEVEGDGDWVHRFVEIGERVDLTPETKERIPYIYEAFNTATGRFIKEVFDGDERVRRLLVKYVVLQLISDAAFCVQRWEEKGGGSERYGHRASDRLEKWLWRALWDLFIAAHVADRILEG